MPQRIRRILFGGKLIALHKKKGGIRPIAVGCYWRRLASKAANNRVMQSLAEYFSPLQLGMGVSGGCEAAVHAARRFLDHMLVMVKLDFANAFNSLHRIVILDAIASKVPRSNGPWMDNCLEVRYCFSAYAAPSSLIFGDFEILNFFFNTIFVSSHMYPSNLRLKEHGIYIRHCQESNSQPVPSQAGADTTRPQ